MNLLFVCSRGTVINYTDYINLQLVSVATISLAKFSEEQTSPRCFTASCTPHPPLLGMATIISAGICTTPGRFCALPRDVTLVLWPCLDVPSSFCDSTFL